MSNISGPSGWGLFYGWYVVGAIGLVLTTTSGLAFYNLSVLLDAFIAQRAFPVTLASGATASYFMASGIGGVVAARLMERLDPRLIMIGGAVVSSVALGCVGLLRAAPELYAFHVVFGLCFGFCGMVPATMIVARWFEARRPLALSIASTGLSLGGILVTPMSAFLITHLGLSGAAPWLGLAFFVGVVPVTALIVRASPQEMGLIPDGPDRSVGAPRPAPRPSVPFKRALRSRFFIILAAAYVFILCAQVGAIAHLFRLTSIRQGGKVAALIVAVLAAASVVGRLSGGWVLLKVSARTLTLAVLAAQVVALAVLAWAPSMVWLLLGTILLGTSVGNIIMLQPLLLVEAFGIRDYGRIYSSSQLVTSMGVAGGPALVGFLFEAGGGYAVAYAAAAGVSLMGLILLGLAEGKRGPAAAA